MRLTWKINQIYIYQFPVTEESHVGDPPVVQWVKDLTLSRQWCRFDPWPTQWVKDPVLPLLWRELKLRLGFDPWPRNFHGCGRKIKKKNHM